MLKDLRIGYIKTIIVNPQAIEQQCMEHAEYVNAIKDKFVLLDKDCRKYRDIAEKCKRKVYLYEQKTEDGHIYRGQSVDVQRRFS